MKVKIALFVIDLQHKRKGLVMNPINPMTKRAYYDTPTSSRKSYL